MISRVELAPDAVDQHVHGVALDLSPAAAYDLALDPDRAARSCRPAAPASAAGRTRGAGSLMDFAGSSPDGSRGLWRARPPPGRTALLVVAAHDRADARQLLAQLEGLHDVVVGAEVQHGDAAFDLAPGRDDQDGRVDVVACIDSQQVDHPTGRAARCRAARRNGRRDAGRPRRARRRAPIRPRSLLVQRTGSPWPIMGSSSMRRIRIAAVSLDHPKAARAGVADYPAGAAPCGPDCSQCSGEKAMDDYYDLGAYKRTVTTSSPEAQTWFDRGLTWLYAFNHAEAIKCFQKALEHDPDCAMAHWGVAYAAGPNYNRALGADGPEPARRGRWRRPSTPCRQALPAAARATPVEQALIGALPVRFPQRDRRLEGPRAAWRRGTRPTPSRCASCIRAQPGDLDVRSLFVDAIMNETPWLMWNLETGQPTRGRRARWRRWRCSTSVFRDRRGGLGSSRPAASLCPPDRDVAVPAAGAAPPATGCATSCPTRSPGAHADPYRRAVRRLPRCRRL